MPTDEVTPESLKARACPFCDTLAEPRSTEDGPMLVCPNDNCPNVFVAALTTLDTKLEPAPDNPAEFGVRPAAAKAAERWKIDAVNEEVTKRFVTDHIGRAEREATAILAEHEPVTAQQVHALVSLAWGRGFVAGFGAGHEAFASMLERIAGGVKP